jgi:hypothetical protein
MRCPQNVLFWLMLDQGRGVAKVNSWAKGPLQVGGLHGWVGAVDVDVEVEPVPVGRARAGV